MNNSLITLNELKDWLGITKNVYDIFLQRIIDYSSKYILSEIKKPCEIITYEELIDGDSSNVILLKKYPIYKILELYISDDNIFDQSELISPSDYSIKKDSGLIILNGSQVFTKGIDNIKCKYKAGLGLINVISGMNDMIDIIELGSSDVEITIAEGSYDYYDIANEIKTKLNDNQSLNGTYDVKYSKISKKFFISSDVTFKLKNKTGSNNLFSLLPTIGFAKKDIEGTKVFSEEFIKVPDNISLACIELSSVIYDNSKKGSSNLNLKSRKNSSSDFEITLKDDEVPDIVKNVINEVKAKGYL